MSLVSLLSKATRFDRELKGFGYTRLKCHSYYKIKIMFNRVISTKSEVGLGKDLSKLVLNFGVIFL